MSGLRWLQIMRERERGQVSNFCLHLNNPLWITSELSALSDYPRMLSQSLNTLRIDFAFPAHQRPLFTDENSVLLRSDLQFCYLLVCLLAKYAILARMFCLSRTCDKTKIWLNVCQRCRIACSLIFGHFFSISLNHPVNPFMWQSAFLYTWKSRCTLGGNSRQVYWWWECVQGLGASLNN